MTEPAERPPCFVKEFILSPRKSLELWRKAVIDWLIETHGFLEGETILIIPIDVLGNGTDCFRCMQGMMKAEEIPITLLDILGYEAEGFHCEQGTTEAMLIGALSGIPNSRESGG
jgi:hypothetical protein